MDPTLLPHHIFPPSSSLEEGAMEWGFMFAPCTDPHVGLNIDPDLNFDMDIPLVPDLSLDLDLDALAEATAPNNTTAQDFFSLPTAPPTTVSDSCDDHDASMLDLPVLLQSFSPHQSTNPLPPKPIPQPSEQCIEQQRQTTCMITATKTLRSLHIIQTSCLSSTNGDSSNNNGSQSRSQGRRGPDPPRRTGEVLKGNKEAGMTVCRMLQCASALRPQNQLVLAIIFARLVAWYPCLSAHPNRYPLWVRPKSPSFRNPSHFFTSSLLPANSTTQNA